MRFGVRVRLAALLCVLLIVSGAALLAISYGLVSTSLHDSVPAPAGPPEVVRGAGGARGATSGFPAGGRSRLAPGAAQQFADHTLHRLVEQYLLVLAGVVLVALGLGWLLAGRILRPLRRVTATARRVSASNLGDRIALEGPHDELRELSDTFDGMLARLEAAFGAQRRFVADASHELRTPLAAMRTEIEVLAENPGATLEDVQGATSTLQRQIQRGETLIESLLTLASSEPELLAREAVDLAELAAEALAEATPHLAQRRLSLRSELLAAPVDGDRHLLAHLVGNLVTNAIKHNTDDGWLVLRTNVRQRGAQLVVANGGAVIGGEEAAQLRQAFRRGGTARTGEGHGLGLSIADAVARAHDAELSIEPLLDGGLRIEVTFAPPLDMPPPASPDRPQERLSIQVT
jgi:signal transduction histidine kinase